MSEKKNSGSLTYKDWSLEEVLDGKSTIDVPLHHETLFFVGNGLIGLRGALDERRERLMTGEQTAATNGGPIPQGNRATYMNGFYDSVVKGGGPRGGGASGSGHTQSGRMTGESLHSYYGFDTDYSADVSAVEASMVPVFDVTPIEVTIDDIPLCFDGFRPATSVVGPAPTGSANKMRGATISSASSPPVAQSGPSNTKAASGTFKFHRRSLDYTQGTLARSARWTSSLGHEVELESLRTPSLEHRNVVAIHWQVHIRKLPQGADRGGGGQHTIRIHSSVASPTTPSSGACESQNEVQEPTKDDGLDHSIVSMGHRTCHSGMAVNVTMLHHSYKLATGGGGARGPPKKKQYARPQTTITDQGREATTTFVHNVEELDTVYLTKFAYFALADQGHGSHHLRYEFGEEDEQHRGTMGTENLTPSVAKEFLRQLTFGVPSQAQQQQQIHYGSRQQHGRTGSSGGQSAPLVPQGLQGRGFAGLREVQKTQLDTYWYEADVTIGGSRSAQSLMRFNLLQLLMSAGQTQGTNFAAKGLTGELFGHYSWDCEIFMLPFFVFNHQQVARQMIQFRIDTIQEARNRAQDLYLAKGALYPFRTLGDGKECQAATACTMQLHMNADIAYAIKLWHEVVVDDDEMLRKGAAEVVLATAQVWIQWGTWDEGEFHLRHVTGPDEYNVLVNDNYYTNLMAKNHLLFACEVGQLFQAKYPDQWDRLCIDLDLEAGELQAMKLAGEAMCLPYDSKHHLHLQEEAFMTKHPWTFPTRSGNLMELYHPLTIYRHQVCKQADIILAQVLLGDTFTRDDKTNNFKFYEHLTTHDSSLTPSTFSIMASELGMKSEAWTYFSKCLTMDVENVVGNTAAGIHAACLAGSWSCIVKGFAGMRTNNGELHFSPYLPTQWEAYAFKIKYAGSLISVSVNRRAVEYTALEEGGGRTKISIVHGITTLHLAKGKTISVPLQHEVRALEFDGVIFDFEAITGREVKDSHFKCWKSAIEGFCPSDFPPFTHDQYLAHLRHHPSCTTAKPLLGLKKFLERTLGKKVPYGDPNSDDATTWTMCGLRDKKRQLFEEFVMQLDEKEKLRLRTGVSSLIADLKSNGISVGCVTPSRSGQFLMRRVFSEIPFDCIIDGSHNARDRKSSMTKKDDSPSVAGHSPTDATPQSPSSSSLQWKPEAGYFEQCASSLKIPLNRTLLFLRDATGFSRHSLEQFALCVTTGHLPTENAAVQEPAFYDPSTTQYVLGEEDSKATSVEENSSDDEDALEATNLGSDRIVPLWARGFGDLTTDDLDNRCPSNAQMTGPSVLHNVIPPTPCTPAGGPSFSSSRTASGTMIRGVPSATASPNMNRQGTMGTPHSATGEAGGFGHFPSQGFQ